MYHDATSNYLGAMGSVKPTGVKRSRVPLATGYTFIPHRAESHTVYVYIYICIRIDNICIYIYIHMI